jgi:hypothetical protein
LAQISSEHLDAIATYDRTCFAAPRMRFLVS